jgi:uncharacterized protein YndB with AHSA1/START domain
MSDGKTEQQNSGIELAYELDEPPQKVWRAISIPELREKWLPQEVLADPAATSVTPGREARYRIRDNEPPFLESTVTFRIAANQNGGTSLRIIHELTDARFTPMTRAAANSNGRPLMRAA